MRAGNQPFDLANLVKAMHQANPKNPRLVMDWAMQALDAKYAEQVNFLTANEQSDSVLIEEIQGPKRKIKMASGTSDNPMFSAACRKQGAAIAIQQHESGNVQIYTDNKEGLLLDDVARILRMEEQEAKGKILTTDWTELAKEGKVEGAEEWYFQTAGQMLLNGSLSCPNTPTHLSLEQIREIVKIGLNPTCFEPNRAKKCQRGVCVSTRDDSCPWYGYGLIRCRKIRYATR